MTDEKFEWLLDAEWTPKRVEAHTNKKEMMKIGMTNEEYDDSWSQSLGYDNINHLNEYNYVKDMECLNRFGIHCKRNR